MKAATRQSYHHGDLKTAILHRAAEVIESEGIEALTLRGIARDLGVSHGAPNRHYKSKSDLLAALAADGWEQITHATLQAAEDESSNDARDKLNAMGRGFLLWALNNKSAFHAAFHPDVERHVDQALRQRVDEFQQTVRHQVVEAQRAGRHADIDPVILTQYTNAVPFGLAMTLLNPLFRGEWIPEEQAEKVAALIDLVVPRSDQ